MLQPGNDSSIVCLRLRGSSLLLDWVMKYRIAGNFGRCKFSYAPVHCHTP